MNTVTIPVIELRQNGASLLLTKLKASELRHFTKIDPFDASKAFDDPDQGYQRPVEESRVRKMGNWLKNELENDGTLRMPTAILLSGRGANLTVSSNNTVTLKESIKLPIIDGQHRKRGFEYAIFDKKVEELGDFEIPVVIMKDINKVDEMNQFRIVNGEAKSVRTDLVNMLLTQIAGLEGEDSIKEKDLWKVVVSQVVKKLNDDPTGPWHDKIVMPDQRTYSGEEQKENPELRHRRIARATSMMTALKPLERTAYVVLHAEHGSVEERVEWLFQIVDGFWRALRALNPACFEEADDYVMQKTPGIFALNQVCNNLVLNMFRGRRDFVESEFTHMIRSSSELTNADYWYVGTDEGRSRGDAGKYGSMKGFSELAAMLIHGLTP